MGLDQDDKRPGTRFGTILFIDADEDIYVDIWLIMIPF